MSETEPLEFVQIAAAKEHLYGMTRSGAVWRYDDIRRLWEALSMRGLTPLKQPGLAYAVSWTSSGGGRSSPPRTFTKSSPASCCPRRGRRRFSSTRAI